MAEIYNPFTNGSITWGPASKVVAVTPDDDNDLPDGICRGLLVGTAGDATIVDASGNTCTLVPLQAGYNPIGVTRVKSTGITADDIWALY